MATSIDVWPENLLSYEAFNAMAGQWNYRPCGMGLAPPVSLKYEAIPMAWRMAGIPRAKWDAIYPDIRLMERAALAAMRESE